MKMKKKDIKHREKKMSKHMDEVKDLITFLQEQVKEMESHE